MVDARTAARALALVGIGLGVAEVLAPRRTAALSGLDGHERLLRLFGWREIASGAVILASRQPERWLWLRVVGDLLDGALLGWGLRPGADRHGRTFAALLAVAPVVLFDVLYARRPDIQP